MLVLLSQPNEAPTGQLLITSSPALPQWHCLVSVSDCAVMGPDTEQSKSSSKAWIFILSGNIQEQVLQASCSMAIGTWQLTAVLSCCRFVFDGQRVVATATPESVSGCTGTAFALSSLRGCCVVVHSTQTRRSRPVALGPAGAQSVAWHFPTKVMGRVLECLVPHKGALTHGDACRPAQMCLQLGMEDGDTIDVFMMQVGGC